MSKRRYTLRLYCAEEGCKDSAFYEYSTRRDYNMARKRHATRKWFCSRHDPNAGNLSPACPSRSFERVMIARKLKEHPQLSKLFWHYDNKVGSGFVFGDGWNAHADDFPEGTKVIVSVEARVILPPDAE